MKGKPLLFMGSEREQQCGEFQLDQNSSISIHVGICIYHCVLYIFYMLIMFVPAPSSHSLTMSRMLCCGRRDRCLYSVVITLGICIMGSLIIQEHALEWDYMLMERGAQNISSVYYPLPFPSADSHRLISHKKSSSSSSPSSSLISNNNNMACSKPSCHGENSNITLTHIVIPFYPSQTNALVETLSSYYSVFIPISEQDINILNKKYCYPYIKPKLVFYSSRRLADDEINNNNNDNTQEQNNQLVNITREKISIERDIELKQQFTDALYPVLSRPIARYNNLTLSSFFSHISICIVRLHPSDDGHTKGSRLLFEHMLKGYGIYGERGYVLYAEPDMRPIRSNWLTRLTYTISNMNEKWVLGSIHRGSPDISDTHYTPNLYHINGNAIYLLSGVQGTNEPQENINEYHKQILHLNSWACNKKNKEEEEKKEIVNEDDIKQLKKKEEEEGVCMSIREKEETILLDQLSRPIGVTFAEFYFNQVREYVKRKHGDSYNAYDTDICEFLMDRENYNQIRQDIIQRYSYITTIANFWHTHYSVLETRKKYANCVMVHGGTPKSFHILANSTEEQIILDQYIVEE